MTVGIILRLTHTGLAGDSIHITDLGDGTDRTSFRKVGAVYVPKFQADGVTPGFVDLPYTTDVALSFRDRGIRGYMNIGHLEADFFFGPQAQRAATGTVIVTASPYTVRPGDRYIFWCPDTPGPFTVTLPKATEHQMGNVQVVDATGIATANTITVLPDATLPDTINGGASATITTNFGVLDLYSDCVSDWAAIGGAGGGVTDHTALTSLVWTASGHTGTGDRLAGFDGGGAAALFIRTSDSLLWGDNSVGSTTTTRYLTPGYDDNLAETIATQVRAPRAGTLQNMRVRHNVTNGNGNSIVYTVRVNSVGSALTVSLASTTADGSDLASTVVIAAGDLLDIEVTKAASVGTSPNNIAVTVELA